MQKKPILTYSGGENESSESYTAMHWMTDELLSDTIEVWSKIYGRPIAQGEAADILRNMKNFYEFICTVTE